MNFEVRLKIPSGVDATTSSQNHYSINPERLSKISDYVGSGEMREKYMERTRDPVHEAEFNKCYKKTKELISEINNVSSKFFLLSLRTIMKTNYTLWNVVKSVKKPRSYIPLIRRKDNRWTITDQKKAEVFANHLEETFHPHNWESDLDLETERNERPMVKLITQIEISKII